jgi:hypothetical protein
MILKIGIIKEVDLGKDGSSKFKGRFGTIKNGMGL